MKQLMESYERDIEARAARTEELRRRAAGMTTAEEHDSLLSRIDLLIAERYELMHSLAMMRKLTGPKQPSPSLRFRSGDAAC